MKNASITLVALSGIALSVLVAATPTSAEPGRHNWRSRWGDHKPHQAQNHRHHRDRAKIFSGSRHYRYFGTDPDRYFGPGPGSYECVGYDCTW